MFWIRKKREHIVDNNGNLIQCQDSVVNEIIKPKRKPYKKTLIIVGIILFAIVAWIGVGAFAAVSKIITKNLSGGSPFLSFLGEVDPNALKGEGDGRINILAIGIGGSGHPGGQLADTIMVASIDPKNKKIALLSIPRDLYVKIPGYGDGKINTAHSTGVQYFSQTGGGPALLKETVSEILDLPIHYYIRMDFQGFVKLVDSLGGVTVNVEKAINDPYYPDKYMKGYEPFYLAAGSQKLNGTVALKYARSRETTSDFDRAARQQQLLVAMKEKTLSLGVLTNPKKISEIMKILGDHLRTDLQIQEMERLISLLKDVDTSTIVSKVLDNSPDGPLISSSNGNGYYLVPKTGNFKQIQRIAHEIFSDPYLTDEKARIQVLNGTGQVGAAKEVQDTLVSYGYNIVNIDTNSTEISQTIIYDYSGGKKPVTLEYLKNRFNAQVKNQPQGQNGFDLTLILGKDYLE